MRFLHTADLHLGQIMYQYYDRVDEHDHFFKQLKEWCGEYHPDALLVSGDVFDIQQPSAAVKAYFNNRFVELHRRFPEMAIVVTAGNHDSASRIEADSEVWGMSGVTLVGYGPASDVLEHDDGWQDRFIVELPTGFIVALPFMSSYRPDVVQSLLERVEQRNAASQPVVLMGHQAVGGSDYTGHSDIGNLRMLTGDEMGKGYDYLALGHIHRPQTLNYDLADEYTEHSSYLSGIMRYSGSALHVSCDEQYPHSVSLVDIDRHNGNVELRRLTINELRHFYLLPDIDKDAAQSAEEIYSLIDDFCTAKGSGYIRLRIDSKTALPADFIQTIYDKLEATGNEVRFNPKTIWENGTEEDGEEKKPDFEVAELQQMTNPLEFVRKIIDQYPELNIGELESDFAEIEAEMQKGEEAK